MKDSINLQEIGRIMDVSTVRTDVTFTEATDATWGRFVICVSIVWILMALMVIAGIWYPASRAMKVQPAEALHDE